jgi:flagellar basal-body rod modification protein FlgD
MSRDARLRERQIHTLERLHELELAQARVEHRALEHALSQQQHEIGQLRQQIALACAQEQALMLRPSGASPAALWSMRNYALWQLGVLAQQQARLEQTQRVAEEARARVLSRYERLAVIRRLRARLAKEAEAKRARRELRLLDDLGAIASHHRTQEPIMSIDAIGLPASSTATSATPAVSETDFLRILMTQLQFQDPLKPVDNEQFVAQLAQFSALEVAEEQNTKLDSVLTMQNTNQVVALLGRSVEASSPGGTATGTITAITFSTSGQPTLTLTPSGAGATTVNVNPSDIQLIQN